MIAAREVLRRYPALRQTWPVKQAAAWRHQRDLRRNPRRMASWYRDMPDMHTRICMSNIEMPEAPDLCRPVDVAISLLDPRGAQVVKKRYHLARNVSLVLEVRDLLPPSLHGQAESGQVCLDFEGEHLGSSRAYFHWYNDRSLASSHEKFGLTIPAVGGYWTVPDVQHDASYRTHLAVVNLDAAPYTSNVMLKDADGQELATAVDIPPGGSRFMKLDALFPDPGSFLKDRPGILYFGNNTQPAIYYYFIANDLLGTWRAQHL